MNNELIPFTHDQFGQVRIIKDETTGEPWFVAKDVTTAIGYSQGTGLSNLLAHIPTKWKGVHPVKTLGGTQALLTISQQGLYFFLGRSDKPKALPYQMWIADEVVPNIVQHGGYLTPSKVEEVLLNPDTIIKLATALKEEMAARQAAQAKLAEVQPKAALVDATFANRKQQSLRLTDVVRKLNGVNTQAIKRDLLCAGYLYCAAGQYRVRSQYRGQDKLFVEKMNSYSFNHDIYATAKGAALIAKLYYENELTMKKGYTI